MRFNKQKAWLWILPLLFGFDCKKADKKYSAANPVAAIREKVVASGLDHPWEILWGPDNHIWMTEREGRISRLDPSSGAVKPVFTINEVTSNGEGGLLGMALHPSFSSSPYVYVVYNYEIGGDYREKLVRYSYTGSTLVSPMVMLDNIDAAGIHNGSRLLIVGDKLYMSTGDAADQSQPQKKNSLNGKILRLNLDGSVPADNPQAGNPFWSFGHRNAQGMVYANNKLYVSEHGPNSDDEINIIEKGRNYGWPEVKGYCDESSERNFCSANNVIEPIKAWTPTIATCGLDYYNSDLISEWKNSLLLVALKNARLYQMKLNSNHGSIVATGEYFTNKYGRLRDICISPAGKVYISTSNGGGSDKIIEIGK